MMSVNFALLGTKFAFRKKKASTLTIISILLSVSLMYSSISINSNMRNNVECFINQSSSPVDIIVSATKWEEPITQDMMTTIEEEEGVDNIAPRIEETVKIQNESNWLSLLMVGIDQNKERRIGELSPLKGSNSINESYCFLSKTATRLLNLSVGDSLEVYTSAGIHYFRVSGYGEVLQKGVLGPVIFIDIETAWEIYAIRYPEHSTNQVLVEITDVYKIPQISDYLQFQFGENYIVSNQKAYSLWIASKFLNYAESILYMLVIVSFFVAIVRILSSFASAFTERQYEIGLMLAYGAHRRNILALMLSEIMIIGALGSVSGVLLGIIMTHFLNHITSLMISVQSPLALGIMFEPIFAIQPSALIISSFCGFLFTVFFGSIPAYLSLKRNIVESLRYESSGFARSVLLPEKVVRVTRIIILITASLLFFPVLIQLLSDVFGLSLIRSDALRVLAIPTLILIFVGISNRIAIPQRIVNLFSKYSQALVSKLFKLNLHRRTLSAVLVFNLFLTTSTLFIVSINTSSAITNSWENTLHWHRYSANVVAYIDDHTSRSTVENMDSMRNVSDSTLMSNTYQFLKYGNMIDTSLIFGVEPLSFQRLASVGLVDSIDMNAGFSVLDATNSCILSEYASSKFGAAIGDSIEVADRTNLTIVGICESSIPVFLFSFVTPLFIFVGQDSWLSVSGESFKADGILLDSKNPSDTVDALSQIPGVYATLISTVVHDYSWSLQMIQTTLNIGLELLVVASIASAVVGGWVNINLRKRELGVLRALGMNSKEIAKVISYENAVPMISGAIFGLLTGLVGSFALMDILASLSGSFTLTIDFRSVFLIIFSLISSFLMSYYAMMQLSKRRVIDLLRNR